MEKCWKGSQKQVFKLLGGRFFKDFDDGAPRVPKEATKLAKDGPSTPNCFPMAQKCLNRVRKWSSKVAQSEAMSLQGTAMTQTSVRLVGLEANEQTNTQTDKQASEHTSHKKQNKTSQDRWRSVAQRHCIYRICMYTYTCMYMYIYIYTYYDSYHYGRYGCDY